MLILTAGNFGKAIGRRLQDSQGARCIDLDAAMASLDSLLPEAGFVGVATWRALPAVAKAIDDACFKHAVRWSMVQLDGALLTCGPLVIPGTTACHHCYLKRAAAHALAPAWDKALHDYYEAHPEAGPSGYPAALVEIGAAALADDAIATSAGARVRTIDILTSNFAESEVIGVHQCPRCRKRAPGTDPTNRSIANLMPRLESFFNE